MDNEVSTDSPTNLSLMRDTPLSCTCILFYLLKLFGYTNYTVSYSSYCWDIYGGREGKGRRVSERDVVEERGTNDAREKEGE